MPINNHLIVALGGTGGRMLYAFRRMLYSKHRAFEPATANIRYLYVDSSTIDIQSLAKNYPVLGGSTKLADSSVQAIPGTVGLRAILDNPQAYPTISGWLGGRENFESILNSVPAGRTEASQIRRLGRVLFAQAASPIRSLMTKHIQDLRQTRRENIPQSNEVAIHFLCGLAGGTGSGSIVDAVAQARATFPQDVRIYIYAFLPERYPVPPEKAGPRYHLNAYASLRELSALSVGSWNPHDVSRSDGQRFKDLPTPFDVCYLFTNENRGPEGHSVTLNPLTETPELAAAFLDQKICEAGNFRWREGGNAWETQESYMVGGAAQNGETASRRSNRPVRSRRFFSFGVKSIRFPESEIEEYLTYGIGRSASLQLLHNAWLDNQGYVDKAPPVDFTPIVRSPAERMLNLLTDFHLTLEAPITASESKLNWEPYAELWQRLGSHYSQEAVDVTEFPNQMDRLKGEFEKAFKKQFRNEGVEQFFRGLGDGSGVKAQAETIRQRVEAGLIEAWTHAKLSASDLEAKLKELLTAIDQWTEQHRQKAVATLPENESQDGGEIRDIATQIAQNADRYNQCGLAARAMGSHKRLVAANSDLMASHYALRTRHHAHVYACEKLLPYVKSLLLRLKEESGEFARFITEQAEALRREQDVRCQESEANDLTKQTVKHYDVKYVRRMAGDIVRDRQDMEANAASVRAALVAPLGPTWTFGQFTTTVREETFRRTVEDVCRKGAYQLHNSYVARNPGANRVLGTNVLDVLERKLGTNPEALQAFATEIMRTASNFLPLDDREIFRNASGVPDPNDPANVICCTTTTVVMPSGGNPEFRKALESAFQGSVRGQMYIAENANSTQELSIVRITNVMPARFAGGLRYYRDQYLDYIRREPKETGKIFLEGDGAELPDLYVPETNPESMRPILMLATELGIVKKMEDNRGRQKLFVVSKDRYGEEVLVSELGETEEESLEKATLDDMEDLTTGVREVLERDYWHDAEKSALRDRLVARVREQNAGKLASDPAAQRRLKARDAAVELVEKTEAVAHAR